MTWTYPGLLWLQTVPGVILVAWVLAEWVRNRRLKAFGDPQVLAVGYPWLRRLSACALLVLGLATAVSILAQPERRETGRGRRETQILLLPDLETPDAATPQNWSAVEASVQTLAEISPANKYGILLPAGSPDVFVAPTLDVAGLQVLLSRLPFLWDPHAGWDLGATLEYCAETAARGQAEVRLVIFTSQLPEEVEKLAGQERVARPPALWVQFPASGEPARYGRRSASGRWDWNLRPDAAFREIAERRAADRSGSRLSLVQWSALLAMLFLSLEFVCDLGSRAGRIGGFVG